ncbi:MAG: WD40 repeat domain-containing protein [Chloroflexi bacterium]|nr:WD40 repeat domain-containing protein [Chloroflexota bacterium]
MKRGLTLLLLLLAGIPVRAQDDTATIEQRFVFQPPAGYVADFTAIEWSPTSEFIAINFGQHNEQHNPPGLWQVYAMTGGDLLFEFSDVVAWYPDGDRLLARSMDDLALQIVDIRNATVETASNRAALVDTGASVHLSPDGTLVAVDSVHSDLQIYDAANLELRYSLRGYALDPYFSHTWSPDSSQLVVVPEDIRYRNLGPRHVWTLNRGLSAPIYNMTAALAWSPDGTRVAAPSDYTKVRIYAATTGELLATIGNYVGGPTGRLQWEANFLLTLSGDYASMPLTLTVWDFDRTAFVFQEYVDLGEYRIEGTELVVFEPFLGSRRIDLTTGQVLQESRFELLTPYPSPDWRWVARPGSSSENDHSIAVYRLEGLEQIATLQWHTVLVKFIVWSPDSRYFASADSSGTVIVWEVQDNMPGSRETVD